MSRFSAGVKASISDHRRLLVQTETFQHSAVPSNQHTLARHRKKRTKDRIYLYVYFTPYWIQQSYQYMGHDSKVRKITPRSHLIARKCQLQDKCTIERGCTHCFNLFLRHGYPCNPLSKRLRQNLGQRFDITQDDKVLKGERVEISSHLQLHSTADFLVGDTLHVKN